MMKKKAMELSINFIVMLIFSIVLLGFGLIFASRLLKVSDSAVETGMPKVDDIALESCLNEGNYVCLSKNKAEVRVDNNVVFGLGIYNDLPTTDEFIYHLYLAKAIDSEGTSIGEICFGSSCYNTLAWTQENWVAHLDSPPYNVEVKANKKIPLLFQVTKGSKPGTYIWNLKICTLNAPGTGAVEDFQAGKPETCPSTHKYMYGSLHKIYISVP
ncbi:MAG: hypothetical protein KKF44_01580 [Nanoarchaeota archaeon]|nr:hypothetical protein [Nanoarchaeota archaeon]